MYITLNNSKFRITTKGTFGSFLQTLLWHSITPVSFELQTHTSVILLPKDLKYMEMEYFGQTLHILDDSAVRKPWIIVTTKGTLDFDHLNCWLFVGHHCLYVQLVLFIDQVYLCTGWNYFGNYILENVWF